MAVLTPLNDTDVRGVLDYYDLGSLVKYTGIPQGVVNSNFDLVTTTGHYILTLFEEKFERGALPFCFAAMEHWRKGGINCPDVMHTHDGDFIDEMHGKPVAILSFLSGRGVTMNDLNPSPLGGAVTPAKAGVHLSKETDKRHHGSLLSQGLQSSVDLCAQAGKLCARMHVIGESFSGQRANPKSFTHWQAVIGELQGLKDFDAHWQPALDVAAHEVRALAADWPMLSTLPRGAVHGDLFPDNVFTDEAGQICGVIDFYFACKDACIYDLAITLNAWCFDAHHQYDPVKGDAFLQAYQGVRTLSDTEKKWFHVAARGAALRFLLLRLALIDQCQRAQNQGAVITPKDPLEYLEKLQFHQTHPSFLI